MIFGQTKSLRTRLLLILGGSFVILTPFFTQAALDAPTLQDPLSDCSGVTPFVTLRWSRVTGATDYDVFKNGGATPIATVADPLNTYDDTAVVAKKIYSYSIIAKSATETSNPSTTKTIVVNRCGTVVTLTATSCLADGPKIDLAWNAMTDAIAYDVIRNGSIIAQRDPSQTTYADTTAVGAQTYTYEVGTVWSDETKNSKQLFVNTPACPVTLTGNGNCNAPGAQASLLWNSLAGVTDYQVFRNGSFLTSVGLSTSFDDKTVQQKQSYDYFVKAIYATDSADSNILSLSGPNEIPRCPPVLTAQNTCNATNTTIPEIVLSWTPTAGATIYNITEAVKGFVAQLTGSPPPTTYTDASGIQNETSYTYTVEAQGSGFSNLPSDPTTVMANCSVNAVPDPRPVLDVTPLCNAGDSQMALSWSPSNNVLYYTIERINTNDGMTLSWNVSGATTTIYDPNVEIGSSYSYRVIAVGNGGTTASDIVISTSVDCTPPSTPTLTSPTPVCTSGQPAVNLSWAQSTNTTKYQIYRDGNLIIEINSPTTTTYPDKSVANATFYTYEVRAVGPGGTTPPGTNSKTVTTFNCTPPTPFDLTLGAPVCSGSTASLTLSWTSSTNASYYDIYRKKAGDVNFSRIQSGWTSTSFTNTGLTQNTDYSYYVEALGPPGAGTGLSDLETSTTPFCPPSTPAITSVTASCSAGKSTIQISWSDSTNTTSYEVRRVNGTIIQTVPYGSPRSIVDDNFETGLTPGQSYSYIVKAIGSGGQADSPPSSSVTANDCSNPGQPVVTLEPICSGSSPRMNVKWNTTSNTVSYDVYRVSIPTGTTIKLNSSPITNNQSSFTFADTGSLQPNTLYTYRVIANGPAGTMPTASTDVSAATLFCVPSQPTLTVTTQCSGGKAVFVLTWTDPTPANTSFYEIRRDDGNLLPISPPLAPPTTTYTDDNGGLGFAPGETHTYTVTAVGPVGSTASDPKTSPASPDCSSPSQPLVTATPACSPFDQALSFNGSAYAYVYNTPTLEVGKNGADFSVEFWFYLRQGATGAWRNITHKGSSDAQRTFAVWMRPSDNRIHYRISTTASYNEGGDSVANIPLNTWTHIAYVKNGNTLQLYLNGALDSSVTLTGTAVHNSGALYIGKDPWYAGVNSLMDEYRIYNRALSTGEISNHYNGGGGQYGTPELGLVMLLHFDEGTGSYSGDYSLSKNEATLFAGVSWADGKIKAGSSNGGPNPQVALTWSPTANTASYEVWRDGVKIVPSTTQTNYLDRYSPANSSLTTGSTHNYKVVAVSAMGIRTESEPVSTEPLPRCWPPTTVWYPWYPYPYCSAGKSVMSLYALYGQPYSNTSRYDIYRDEGLGFSLIASSIANTGYVSHADNNSGVGLEDGKTYTYKILGVGPTGLTTESVAQPVEAAVCSPPTPLNPISLNVTSFCSHPSFQPITLATWTYQSQVDYNYLYKNGSPLNENGSLNGFSYNSDSTTLKHWLVLGPFPNTADSGLATDFVGNEAAVKPRRGDVASGLTWQYLNYWNAPSTGYVNLQSQFSSFGTTDKVAYALTYIYSDSSQTGELRVGSDDGTKAYLNGTLIINQHTHDAAVLDEYRVPVTLNAGVNVLMVKVENHTDSWGFFARFTDSSGNLLGNTISGIDSSGVTGNSASYYAYVYASGSSATSPPVTHTPLSCAPAQPAVIITPRCDSQESVLELAWQTTENTNYYQIWRGTSLTNIAPLPGAQTMLTTYTDRTIESNKTYFYAVEAIGNGSTLSDAVPATSLTCTILPDKPILNEVHSTCLGTASRIVLDWPDTANVLSYTVHRDDTNDSIDNFSPLTPSVTTSAFTDGGVVPGQWHAYRIEAVGSSGSSFSDPPFPATTALDCSGPPAPPALNSVTTVPLTTNVLVSWVDKSLNENGFRILACAYPPCSPKYDAFAYAKSTLLAQLYDSFFRHLAIAVPGYDNLPASDGINNARTNQVPGVEDTTYEYQVEAFNEAGSSLSNSLSVCVPIPPPGNFSITSPIFDVTCQIANIDWSDAATTPKGGPVTYGVSWSRDGINFTNIPSCQNLTESFCTTDSVTQGSLWYKVTARNNALSTICPTNFGDTTEVTVSANCLPIPTYKEIIPR